MSSIRVPWLTGMFFPAEQGRLLHSQHTWVSISLRSSTYKCPLHATCNALARPVNPDHA